MHSELHTRQSGEPKEQTRTTSNLPSEGISADETLWEKGSVLTEEDEGARLVPDKHRLGDSSIYFIALPYGEELLRCLREPKQQNTTGSLIGENRKKPFKSS